MPKAIPRWKPTKIKARPEKETAHYRTSDWSARRLMILVRDAYTCHVCRHVIAGKAAHVDHIVPLEDNGTDADTNLQTLCAACHGLKTRAEQRGRGYMPGGRSK